MFESIPGLLADLLVEVRKTNELFEKLVLAQRGAPEKLPPIDDRQLELPFDITQAQQEPTPAPTVTPTPEPTQPPAPTAEAVTPITVVEARAAVSALSRKKGRQAVVEALASVGATNLSALADDGHALARVAAYAKKLLED